MVSIREIEVGEEITISYIDQGIEDVVSRKLMLMQEYYFDCCCRRCQTEDAQYDPREKFLHQLERTGKLATLNRAALHYEVENPPACLKALILLIEGVK